MNEVLVWGLERLKDQYREAAKLGDGDLAYEVAQSVADLGVKIEEWDRDDSFAARHSS